MTKIQTELLRILVGEEIDRIVAQAARGSGFVRAGAHAYALAKQFPNCGLSGTELVNEIVAAASKAGVAVEIYQPLDRAA
jgi:hypothetical protein